MRALLRSDLRPDLEVRVLERRALHYTLGGDPALDRPAHVRAASSVVRLGDRLAIVQDDTSILALVEDGGAVVALPLPHVVEGARQFDDLRGNKRHKLDLEACVVVGDRVIGFGSGSTAARERLMILHQGEVTLFDASSLYASLRRCTAFSGSELNIEGATLVEDRLRLFQRGNGAARGALLPVDATIDLSVAAFVAYLDGGPEPALGDVTEWDLGMIDGVRLGFTDATTHEGRVWFLAAAEASPDATRDGPCAGVVLGVVDRDGARTARLRDFDLKAEGLAFDGPRTGVLVVDRDDPAAPAELCRFELRGPW